MLYKDEMIIILSFERGFRKTRENMNTMMFLNLIHIKAALKAHRQTVRQE